MRGMFTVTVLSVVLAILVSGAPVPFEEAEEFVDASTFTNQELTQATRLSTLKNIRDVKAYCIAAYRKALSIKEGVKHHWPIVDFIVSYGESATPKKNIVSEYAKAIGTLKRAFKHGISEYVISSLDRSVVFGKGVMKQENNGQGTYSFLDHKAIGLEAMPGYFKKLKVPLANYITARKHVHDVSIKADSKAASAYLIKMGKHMYKDYFKNLDRHNKHEHAILWKKVTTGALKGQLKAWLTHKHKLHPLVPGGILAAQKVVDKLWRKLQMPSDRKLRRIAKKQAVRWMRRHKRSVSKVIEAIENWSSLTKKQRAARRKAGAKAREARSKARYARLLRHKNKKLRKEAGLTEN